MTFIAQIGQGTLSGTRRIIYLFAIAWALLVVCCRPRYWPATTREVLSRQILFTAVEALGFISLLAFLTGISVVVQAQLWLGRAGQSAMLGQVLVMVIMTALAPLLVNFIVLGRSGTAIAAELANMKIAGEINVLEAQGIDPFLYLAMPRILAMMISIFCLTFWFIIVSFVSGYGFGVFLGIGAGDPMLFINSILKGVHAADLINLFAKTLVPGMLMSSICVLEGLNVHAAVTEVPQAVTRAVVRSIVALFLVSAIVTILTYA